MGQRPVNQKPPGWKEFLLELLKWWAIAIGLTFWLFVAFYFEYVREG